MDVTGMVPRATTPKLPRDDHDESFRSRSNFASDRTPRRHSGLDTFFGEQIFRILMSASQALEHEHLAILKQQRDQQQHHPVAKLGHDIKELSGHLKDCAEGTPRSAIDDLDADSHDLAHSDKHPQLPSPHLPCRTVEFSSLTNATESAHTERTERPGSASQAGGTGTFLLLDVWVASAEDQPDEDETQFARLQYLASLSRMLRRQDTNSSLGRLPLGQAGINPSSRPQRLWDVLAAVMLAYDGFLTPMMVFDIPESLFTFLMAVLVMLYWTIDLCISFCAGYELADGGLELRFRYTAWRYLTTWFALDVVVLSVDWMTLGPLLAQGFESFGTNSRQTPGLVRLGKVARFLRVLRFARLLRLGKIGKMLRHIHDLIGLESTAIIFSIMKNICLIFVINHFLACLWFQLGLQQESDGWLAAWGGRSDKWWKNYALSLHWSISNFTPGSSSSSPQTFEEVSFAILVLFFALVVFSVFVSSTTSLISRLVNMKSSQRRQIWILKGFLQQNQVPTELRDRVLRYVHTALGSRKDTHNRSEVELLSLLSRPLQEEVQSTLHLRTLHVHPLFKTLELSGPSLMRRLSTEAFKETSFSHGDMVFSHGDLHDRMGFLEHGVLEYVHIRKSGGKALQDSTLLSPGHFFSEAALWTNWRCRGNMQVDSDCQLLEIHGEAFRRILTQHRVVRRLVQEYAKAFVEALNQVSMETSAIGGQLTDLQDTYLHEEPVLKFFAEPWGFGFGALGTPLSRTALGLPQWQSGFGFGLSPVATPFPSSRHLSQ